MSGFVEPVPRFDFQGKRYMQIIKIERRVPGFDKNALVLFKAKFFRGGGFGS